MTGGPLQRTSPAISNRQTPLQVHDLVVRQREYFLSGATRPIEWRVRQLEAMRAMFE